MQQVIMTPINFVSFIVSLALVDIHYTQLRMQTQSRSRLSNWSYNSLFRGQPYEDVRRRPSSAHEPWYYHSKQKKLMRMEAEEAFRLRRIVVIGLAVTTAAVTTGVLYSVKLLFSRFLG